MAAGRFTHSSSGTAGWTSMTPGQTIWMRARSPLHKDVYECTVVAVSREDVRITMPTEKGKLVLVPVGTEVSVQLDEDGDSVLEAVVADRRGGGARSLLLRPASSGDEAEEIDDRESLCPVVAITSGKGGVGKSFFTVNLGAALSELGLKVAIVDVDLGTANVDVLLNLSPRYTLSDMMRHRKSIFDVVVEGPQGLIVLPGASGLQQVTQMSDHQYKHVFQQMELLQRHVDIMLLDTGSGISQAVTRFVLAADDAVLVTTPEPHAIVDAYALVKVLASFSSPVNMGLVVNKVRHEAEANTVATKMLFAGERFLQAKMKYLGFVLRDDAADEAVRHQRLLNDVRRVGGATENFRHIATRIASTLDPSSDVPSAAMAHGGRNRVGPRTFLQRIRDLFSR